MSNAFGTRQRLETSVRIDPRVVLSSHLLQLAQADLEQAIEAELAENPALEKLQDDTEPILNDQILQTVAPSELRFKGEDYEYIRSSSNDDASTDWTELTPALPDLRAYLVAQLLPRVPANLTSLAHYVIDSLNEKGYLEEPDEEIALALNCSLEDVQAVVTALQSCEPAGVGARNLTDCLLLQLRTAESIEQRLARAILRTRMDDFLARRTMRIARRYGVMPDLVESAFAEIVKLTPYPGESFQIGPASRQPKMSTASPDLIITRSDTGWSVDIRGPESTSLCISRSYRQREEQLRESSKDYRDEKRHVQHYVQRAGDFISSLEQRKKTLRAIGEYLLREQAGFLNTGSYQFLRPLTRTQMAADLNLHESTVSRATADKFVQIPTGSVVSFDVFFRPALRVQKMIEEILASENPDNPLSDDRIAELLKGQGVHVARRTVNKYRDRTKLLSSRKRRSA
ncbi:MAG TPA: RNA polymerase factor sigma-54 [Fimbriimonas sp.]|nr:RNA polymerase factor sigma-54 [Fimbriimonas sp.]